MEHLNNSILTSVKENLGLYEDDTEFDAGIVMYINTALSELIQMGVGHQDGFIVTNETQTWDEFLDGRTDIPEVKTYVFLKVKILFDPPTNARIMEAYESNLKQIGYRARITMGEY